LTPGKGGEASVEVGAEGRPSEVGGNHFAANRGQILRKG